tara:strand:+ start:10032 stop:10313 length:282 start_codon:yes stop_codon:yes gene_type:complete
MGQKAGWLDVHIVPQRQQRQQRQRQPRRLVPVVLITGLVLTAIPRRHVMQERRQRGTVQTIVLLEHAQQQQQQQQPPRRVLELVHTNGCLAHG